MSTQANTLLTPEEYLAIERKAEFKSEYFNGQMFAMSGASWPHGRLVARLTNLFESHFKGTPCQTVPNDIRVHVAERGLYTYPDVVVVCGEPKFIDSNIDTLLNPTLLIEVLSPSTENYDRGTKATLYRSIPALKELLLISQGRYEIELRRRSLDGTWSIIDRRGPDSWIELTSIGYKLFLAELYAGILPEAAAHS